MSAWEISYYDLKNCAIQVFLSFRTEKNHCYFFNEKAKPQSRIDARLQQKFRFLPFLINAHPFVSFFLWSKKWRIRFFAGEKFFSMRNISKNAVSEKERHNFFARPRQQQPTLLVTATSDCCIEYQELRKWMELRRNCYCWKFRLWGRNNTLFKLTQRLVIKLD